MQHEPITTAPPTRSGAPQRRGPLAIASGWSSTTAGQWVVNSPLLRLPENLKVGTEQRWLDIGCGRAGLLQRHHMAATL